MGRQHERLSCPSLGGAVDEWSFSGLSSHPFFPGPASDHQSARNNRFQTSETESPMDPARLTLQMFWKINNSKAALKSSIATYRLLQITPARTRLSEWWKQQAGPRGDLTVSSLVKYTQGFFPFYNFILNTSLSDVFDWKEITEQKDRKQQFSLP